MFKVILCTGPKPWAVVRDERGATPYISKHATKAEAIRAAKLLKD